MPAWYFLIVLLHLTLAISESYADDHKGKFLLYLIIPFGIVYWT